MTCTLIELQYHHMQEIDHEQPLQSAVYGVVKFVRYVKLGSV